MTPDWYAMVICPRCFREWCCWTTQREHRSRPMARPHAERVQLTKNMVK